MNLIADLLFFAAALALGYAAVLAVARLPVLPVRALTISGPLREVTPAQIASAAREAVTGNLFAVDLDAVRAAFSKLPWVRRVEAWRRWPDGIALEIEEHVAVARWQQADDAEAQLVNSAGEVFAAASDAPLPLLAGPEGTAAAVLARYRELLPRVEPLGWRPRSLSLSPRQAWQLQLDDGAVLELGRDQDKSGVNERLQRFVAAHGQMAGQLRGRIAAVDLRYPNGFAVRLARAGEEGK
ncbi:MAG: cell division protein FtsQ/DivIB [Zoogloeaceae bacterium]|jgi:cell division protein FtsQ|nr:cell division protein FtsQ/DivIB [Zoogloeaceae bacterium]